MCVGRGGIEGGENSLESEVIKYNLNLLKLKGRFLAAGRDIS